jgi:hypothetical protein
MILREFKTPINYKFWIRTQKQRRLLLLYILKLLTLSALNIIKWGIIKLYYNCSFETSSYSYVAFDLRLIQWENANFIGAWK